MKSKGGFVYILTNKNNSTLYTGATGNLFQRVLAHKKKTEPKSFTARYNLFKLVYYECFSTITDAIKREKQLKAGSRSNKVTLINEFNPEWEDLFGFDLDDK